MLTNVLIVMLILGYLSGALALASIEDFERWYEFIGYFIFYILILWFLWLILLLMWKTNYGSNYYDD